MFIRLAFVLLMLTYPCLSEAGKTVSFKKHHYTTSHVMLDFIQLGLASDKRAETMDLLEHYVDENIPEALYIKGILLLNGCYNQGQRNPREATLYFSRAAAMDFIPALSALADSFLNGDGAELNESAAFKYYKIAADLGYGTAQFNLAVLYRDGIGTKPSVAMAKKYFKMASQNPELKDLQEEALQLYNELVSSAK